VTTRTIAAALWRQPITRGLVLALAYFLTGKAGLLLAIPPGYATAIWPPSGIALAGLLLLGRRYWPGVWLGSFLTNIAVAALSASGATPQQLLIAAAIASGGAAQAALGATLIRRVVGFPTPLATARDVFRFLLHGGPIACLVAPTCGVGVLAALGAIPLAGVPYSWWTWWVGDMIGVLIFAPLTLMWFDDSAQWRSRRGPVTLSLLVTFAAAVLVFLYASRSEWRALQADFAEDTARISTALNRRVELHYQDLQSVVNFFAASAEVKRAEFQRFTRSIVADRGDMLGIGLVSQIARADRAAVEKTLPATARREFFYEPTYPFPRAADRDLYYPVLLFTPRTDVDISGIDLGGEPARRAAIERARDTGEMTGSAKIPLAVVPSRPADGFLLVQPIYDNDDPQTIDARRAHLKGYAVGFFRLSQFIGHSDIASVATNRVRFTIDDVTELPGRGVRLFDYGPEAKPGTTLDISVTRTFDVGGRRWRIVYQPTVDYVTRKTTFIIWLVLAGGLLFSAMVGIGALILTGRTSEIEALVQRRTDELAVSNEKLSLEVRQHVSTEAQLTEERVFLELILDNLSEGVMVFDTDGRITVTNVGARRTLARIWGRDEDQRPGETPLLHADGFTPVKPEDRPLPRVLRGESIVDLEVLTAVSERKPVALVISARPLFDITGARNGALMIMRDVTESRAGERLKREFISVISHELRTPLTSIRGSLGLITGGAAGVLPEQAHNLASIAFRNVERLSLLINDILDIDKIESGHLTLDMQIQPIATLVEQAVEANAGFARECDITLVIDRDLQTQAQEVDVMVDGHRLLQVLANLLSNAAKFSPRGAVVSIGAQITGDSIRVSVSDNGPGIAADFQARIFQKFSQADGSDTRAKRGTGLGLAISKALIERMGGTIDYVTRIGHGTTFFFDLPLAAPRANVVTA
jgi:signal transduction histidine kinase/integral membrane sensor domain MASE1